MELKININTREIAMGLVRGLAHHLHHDITNFAAQRFHAPNMPGQFFAGYQGFGNGMPPAFGAFPMQPMMHPMMHPGMMPSQRAYPTWVHMRAGLDAARQQAAQEQQSGMPGPHPDDKPADTASTTVAKDDRKLDQFSYETVMEEFCKSEQVITFVEQALIKQLEAYANDALQPNGHRPPQRTF